MIEDLVERDRARVVYIGIDHRVLAAVEPRRPAARRSTSGRSCSASARTSCTRTAASRWRSSRALRERHGFDGRLVLAGPHARVRHLRSEEEAIWRAAHPLRARRVDLESVDEAEKAWLYANAALVLYPTVREGFGLVPFEAAAAGTPTLWAAHSSLAELLPARRGGDRGLGRRARRPTPRRALLADAEARARLVGAVREAGAALRLGPHGRARWSSSTARRHVAPCAPAPAPHRSR